MRSKEQIINSIKDKEAEKRDLINKLEIWAKIEAQEGLKPSDIACMLIHPNTRMIDGVKLKDGSRHWFKESIKSAELLRREEYQKEALFEKEQARKERSKTSTQKRQEEFFKRQLKRSTENAN